ncbi:D-alanyl-D-alanine carboxypeptidase/D-alanyl-D-alanine endopeptidase [Methylocaldum szegediense]|uniref:Serine-type D-Ala-D-Ala carboxypeptidase/endopeptidase (Penicillin-binding protein 4) n=1 Tax=Methylocaldum szegediense TaxID=73780 RepID=A0ABM9HXZ7_9GAMM|nr:D-alanyl-D-alanine carboxypeptidase/D-alanyl-D-alanine-endopeptidase [Methylocaldum szegediense]CAI8761171.1 serine-type D-Ala-D-Ala carboxypeptidase/endopeptidase (penicillin-binding protein 4) [Methylocaldum szegediense]
MSVSPPRSRSHVSIPFAKSRDRSTFTAYLALIVLFILGSSCSQSVVRAADPQADPSAAGLRDAITTITSQSRYAQSTWGYSVMDLTTGEVLLAEADEKMFVPGSILKAYSTATVLNAYTHEYRFRTPVYRTGPIDQGVLDGHLILVATGDFSFGLRDRPDDTLAFNSAPEIDHNYADTGLPGPAILKDSDPLAALDELAAQVRAAGIRAIKGDVIIDDRLFETFREWPDGIISPIWINENVLDITLRTTASGRVAIDWRPKTAAYKVEAGKLKVVSKDAQTVLKTRLVEPGTVEISGQIAAGEKPLLQIWQIPNPADFARTAFIEALRRAEVTVGASTTGRNPVRLLPSATAYSEESKVAEHVSPPLAEFTKVIMKVSYNRGADLMLCLVAVKAGSRNCLAGIAEVTKTLVELGVPIESTFLFDGAGSDERDRTTPAAMTAFLRAVSGESYGETFRQGLPILGVDGTLAMNQQDSPAAGHVFAKTGSRIAGTPNDRVLITGLTHVGYIDAKSGRRLVHAVMLRDVPLASIEDLSATEDDLGAIEAIIQQGF